MSFLYWLSGFLVLALYPLSRSAWYVASLPMDHRTLAERLGLSNIITLIRGVLISALGGMLFVAPPVGLTAWLPGLVFGAALLTDLFDGRIARSSGTITDFGASFDPEMDAYGGLTALAMLIHLNSLPAIALGIGALYYVYRTILYLWRRFELPVAPLKASRKRAWIGSTFLVIVWLLLLPLWNDTFTLMLHTAFLISAVTVCFSFGTDLIRQLQRHRNSIRTP